MRISSTIQLSRKFFKLVSVTKLQAEAYEPLYSKSKSPEAQKPVGAHGLTFCCDRLC